MIIGLTGRIASGKGVVSDYLKSKGFEYFSLSNEVREEAKARSMEITRQNLQNLGNEMRANYGRGVLALKVIKRMNETGIKEAIIDGIRNPEEVTALKNEFNGGFYLISVDAPQKMRFERVNSRSRESDPKNWDDFLAVDRRDFGESIDSGQQVGKCMSMAYLSLINDSTIEDFNKKIEKLLERIVSDF